MVQRNERCRFQITENGVADESTCGEECHIRSGAFDKTNYFGETDDNDSGDSVEQDDRAVKSKGDETTVNGLETDPGCC